MNNYLEYIFGLVASTVVGAISWLVRTVLTNQKQIALLQQEISDRDKKREEDREFWRELKSDLKSEMKDVKDDIEEVRAEMLEIWKQK